MRILITGGAGFLGSHLADLLLSKGHRVAVVDDLSTGRRDNVPARAELLEMDVRHPRAEALIASFDPERIYSMACPASPPAYQRDHAGTLETIFKGTLACLRAGQRLGARVLLASTSEVYGDPPPEEHPQREGYRGSVSTWGLRACYDEGKRCAEALGWSWQNRGVGVRVARIFNSYGPRMSPDDGRVVTNFCAQAIRGEPLTIYGDGAQTRSLCYASDTVRGLEALMESEVEGPVNVGNPAEVTVLDLAVRVLRLAGRGAWRMDRDVEFRPLPQDDPRRRRPDVGRAERLLGWRPEVGLDEGLARTFEHLRRRLASA